MSKIADKTAACWNHKGSRCPNCDGSGRVPYVPKKRSVAKGNYGGLRIRIDPAGFK